MSKKILILGSTGLVGSSCLDILIEKKEVSQVICLGRRHPHIRHPKVESHLVDFTEIDLWPKEYFHVDATICCLGTTIKKAGSQQNFKALELDQTLRIAKHSHIQGCDKFLLVSSMGADPQSKIFYLKTKGQIEEQIKQLNFRSLTILRPSLLLGKRAENRPGEIIGKFLMTPFSKINTPGFNRFRPIEAGDVAKILANRAVENQVGTHTLENQNLFSCL